VALAKTRRKSCGLFSFVYTFLQPYTYQSVTRAVRLPSLKVKQLWRVTVKTYGEENLATQTEECR